MIALIRNKQGEIIPCKAIKGKITDITQDWVFKEKILNEDREISISECIKALKLNYRVKVQDDLNEDIIFKVVEGNNFIDVYGDYLPKDELDKSSKFYLEGAISYGEWFPF